mgnify:CR=1 FL=1
MTSPAPPPARQAAPAAARARSPLPQGRPALGSGRRQHGRPAAGKAGESTCRPCVALERMTRRLAQRVSAPQSLSDALHSLSFATPAPLGAARLLSQHMRSYCATHASPAQQVLLGPLPSQANLLPAHPAAKGTPPISSGTAPMKPPCFMLMRKMPLPCILPLTQKGARSSALLLALPRRRSISLHYVHSHAARAAGRLARVLDVYIARACKLAAGVMTSRITWACGSVPPAASAHMPPWHPPMQRRTLRSARHHRWACLARVLAPSLFSAWTTSPSYQPPTPCNPLRLRQLPTAPV